jgi:2-amino-4-hydroxy-6-hydroxymethyldihydropteridine diphosphokinase
MNTVYLSIGSNIEPRAQYISQCIKLIREMSQVRLISSVYETKPLGFESETTFFNLMVAIDTKMTPLELLSATKTIEQQLGRKTKSNQGIYESRVIDIDIILFGRQIIISEELIIPHPHYGERNFVLLPLIEIAEEATDPLTQQSIKECYSNINVNNMSTDVLRVFSLDNLY